MLLGYLIRPLILPDQVFILVTSFEFSYFLVVLFLNTGVRSFGTQIYIVSVMVA